MLVPVYVVALQTIYFYSHPDVRGEASLNGHERRDNRTIAFHGMSPYYSKRSTASL